MASHRISATYKKGAELNKQLKKGVDMSRKLPEKIVEDLNNAGMGGRLVYIPLRNRARTISNEIYDAMISTLKEGKVIDIDDFPNMVSLRTLYRLKAKAMQSFSRMKQ